MRTSLMVFHRWLALVTSVLILVLAVTGSALVFEGAIDRGMHPALWRVTPASAALSLDTLVARVRAERHGAPVTGLTLAREPDRAYVAQSGPVQIFIDPFTGRTLGTRDAADAAKGLPRRLHVLHTSLMNKRWGGTVVALVTIAALLLVVTGVYIWWKEKLWRVRWSASWKRIAFDLHHTLGVMAALVLFVITSSGLVIHYRVLSKAIGSLDGVEQPQAVAQPPRGDATRELSLDSLAGIGRRVLPGASIAFMSMPAKADQPFVLAMRFPEDRTPGGRSRVIVDRFRGTVLLAVSTRDAKLGTAINNVMRSSHTGDILGKPTEIIWLLAAIVLAMQAVTGVLMWWNGRTGRAALARKASSAAPVQ